MSVFFGENLAQAGHGRLALRSGAVSIVARLVNAFIQIGSVLFLARLLSPEDYGVAGMVTTITSFAPLLVDLGSRDAIVQRARISEGEVSALFWMTQFVGLTCAIAIAVSGPAFSWFYREPRLTMIAIVSSVTFLTAALTAQHYALLRRAMMFQEIGIVEVVANLVGATLAVVLALYGFHYWALVLRPILASTLLAAGTWFQCRWFPTRPVVTEQVKEMTKFGLNVTGFTTTDFVGRSADRVAIGYKSGPAALGYYQNALFVYENLIDIVVSPLHGVGISALSKLRHDLPALIRSWEKALSTLAFFAMPAFAGLAVTSRDLIVVLLGTKWISSGTLLSVLAIRGMPHTVERTCGWLHVTAGRTDRWMRWGIILAASQCLALMIGLRFGPMGVATAYVIVMFVLCVPSLMYAGQPFGIGARHVVRAVWRPMLAALVAMCLGFALRSYLPPEGNRIVRLLTLAGAFVGTYFILAVGLLGVRQPLQAAWSLCTDLLLNRMKETPAVASEVRTYEGV